MSKELPSGTGEQNQGTELNCFSCCHFYITYETQFPYGCRKAGFKVAADAFKGDVRVLRNGVPVISGKENPQKTKPV